MNFDWILNRLKLTKAELNGDATQNFSGLTFTGTDIAIDTNVLKSDSTNNRIGINQGTPSEALDVVGNATISGNITAGGVIISDAQISTLPATGKVFKDIVAAGPLSGTGYIIVKIPPPSASSNFKGKIDINLTDSYTSRILQIDFRCTKDATSGISNVDASIEYNHRHPYILLKEVHIYAETTTNNLIVALSPSVALSNVFVKLTELWIENPTASHDVSGNYSILVSGTLPAGTLSTVEIIPFTTFNPTLTALSNCTITDHGSALVQWKDNLCVVYGRCVINATAINVFIQFLTTLPFAPITAIAENRLHGVANGDNQISGGEDVAFSIVPYNPDKAQFNNMDVGTTGNYYLRYSYMYRLD